MSSYSEYLEEHLQGHLTKAIAEAAIRNPKDSVDFIANYLLKIVDDDAATKKRKAIRAAWAAEDEELELKRQQKLMAALNRKEAEEQRKSQEEAFFVQIAKCSNKTEAMQLWTEFVAERTKSVSVYIGSPCKLKQDDEESTALLYDAVSSAEDEYLLRTAFAQSETKGIVFDLLKSEEDGDAEEEDNDEDEDDGASPKKEDPPKPRKRIHLENVLFPNAYRERLHFFKYPKVGSFLSFESAISSYLNPEAIRAPLRPQWPRPVEEVVAEQKAKEDQEQRAKEEAAAAAAADEEEEPKEEDAAENEEDGGDEEEEAEEQKEEEIIPDPPRTISKFVVCLDTMGDDQQYDDDTVQWIDQSIGKLEGALMTIDVMEYLKQREHGTKMTAKLAEYSESLKAEIDAKTQEIEAEHEADPEPKKEFKKKNFCDSDDAADLDTVWGSSDETGGGVVLSDHRGIHQNDGGGQNGSHHQ